MRFLLAVLIAIPLGLVPAFIARSKGRNFALWWLYGWALFIVALPHSTLIEPHPFTATTDEEGQGETKPCPKCAEIIKAQALKCHFCGYDLRPLRKRSWFVPVVIAGDVLLAALFVVLSFTLFHRQPTYRSAGEIVTKLKAQGIPCSPVSFHPPTPDNWKGLVGEAHCLNGVGLDLPNAFYVDVFQAPRDMERTLPMFFDEASCLDDQGNLDKSKVDVLIARDNWDITVAPLSPSFDAPVPRQLIERIHQVMGGKLYDCSSFHSP